MNSFDDIYALAAARKGGPKALEKLLPKPKTLSSLRKIPDPQWLSEMTKNVFRAGFVWRVVDAKWPAFETAFHSFDIDLVAYMSDEALDNLLVDDTIIRHRKKLYATRDNAHFLCEISAEYGSAGKFFTAYSPEQYVALLGELKKRASRMGGTSAQYFLRSMGVDSFILSRDVTKALIREKVISKPVTSKKSLLDTQSAFNAWRQESGRSLTEISRALAFGIDA